MANITASDVNKLRQLTGVGMMDCKKALVECDGDFDKAIDFLRQKGQKMAAKRADRDANEGCVLAKSAGNYGAVIMLSCETDFVATNADFVAFTNSIIDTAMAKHLSNKEEVLSFNHLRHIHTDIVVVNHLFHNAVVGVCRLDNHLAHLVFSPSATAHLSH